MTNDTMRKFGYPESLIREYEHWVVLLRPAQVTLGSLVLAAKSNATAFGQLPAGAHAELAAVTSEIEATLNAEIGYEKINYLMLMMVDPHPGDRFAKQMCDTRRGVPPSRIDQPFVTDRILALDEFPEEARYFGIGVDDLVEIIGLADQDLAPDDRLDAIVGRTVVGQDPFAGKSQGYDLPPSAAVALEFRKQAGADQHHLVPRYARFTK